MKKFKHITQELDESLDSLKKALNYHKRDVDKLLSSKNIKPSIGNHVSRIMKRYGNRFATGAVAGAVAGSAIDKPITGALVGLAASTVKPIKNHINSISKFNKSIKNNEIKQLHSEYHKQNPKIIHRILSKTNMSSFTPDEMDIIKKHMSSEYRTHSVYDKQGKKLTQTSTKSKKENDIRLNKIISSKKTPMDMIVYHGVARGYRNLLNLPRPKNTKIHIKHKLSTSIDNEEAEAFARNHDDIDMKHSHVLALHLPKGSNALYLGKGYSFDNEKEVVVGKGRIHLSGKKTTFYRNNGEKKVTYHYGHYETDKE